MALTCLKRILFLRECPFIYRLIILMFSVVTTPVPNIAVGIVSNNKFTFSFTSLIIPSKSFISHQPFLKQLQMLTALFHSFFFHICFSFDSSFAFSLGKYRQTNTDVYRQTHIGYWSYVRKTYSKFSIFLVGYLFPF